MTVLDEFPRLSSSDHGERLSAAVRISLHLNALKVDAIAKSDYERLARQIGSYDEWPYSEQQRFRRLAMAVRAAIIQAGATGPDGFPVKE